MYSIFKNSLHLPRKTLIVIYQVQMYGSLANSTCYSNRGLGFSSQHHTHTLVDEYVGTKFLEGISEYILKPIIKIIWFFNLS